jgi:hypothetical protein
MVTIFSPLSGQIWGMHVLMMVFGGLAILFMEATGDLVRSRTAPTDASDGEGGDLSVDGVLVTMFEALAHFLWNGPKHDPRTVGGKVAILALSLHTLIIAATYTASLAGILSTSSKVPVVVLSFRSIQKSPLTSITGKLCVLQAAQVRAVGGWAGV